MQNSISENVIIKRNTLLFSGCQSPHPCNPKEQSIYQELLQLSAKKVLGTPGHSRTQDLAILKIKEMHQQLSNTLLSPTKVTSAIPVTKHTVSLFSASVSICRV